MSKREEFLAGERVDDVAFFLHEDAVGNLSALDDYAEQVEDGVVLVVEGDSGRSAFQSATGIDPMGLAREAMQTDGEISRDLTGGVCPASEDDPDGDHAAKFVFAFAEERNEEVGGVYAEGDVIHAYGVCTCGERYSEKWVVGDE
ncbi:DUF5807 family protein [Halomicrobium urmianum]|uniref:DUF5807 family protein n=1 Tax=Halomicrobium urmianum TaxID=1586233 RepID=UPI001CD9FF54|nr:DUF5807 family protein [Halomicrobium urmianum]